MLVHGKIISGHGVASGRGLSRYPAGTISLQKPYFLEGGLDLSPYYEGTLNVDIAPAHFKILKPDYHFPKMLWIESHQPETFSFCKCTLLFHEKGYDSLIYYPSPDTKEIHFQPASVVEILAPFVEELADSDGVQLELDTDKIQILF